jgi:hypothetical protein
MFGPIFKREHGKPQPYIPLGPFQVRLPFIHYRFELPDYIQGLMMCAVCLGIIPVLTEYLGMPKAVSLQSVRHRVFVGIEHQSRLA